MRSVLGCVIIMSTFAFQSVAQRIDSASAPKNWFLEDPADDHVEGVSAEKTYITLLQGQPSKTVLVAVIDSGVDPEHEDLKNVIWTNPGEIAGNGVDDDHNGYIDDVHGWNFLGNKNANVVNDTYELTREYIRLKQKFDAISESKIPKKQKSEYAAYQKIKTKFEKLKAKNEDDYNLYSKLNASISFCLDTLRDVMHTDSVTALNLAAYTPTAPILVSIKQYIEGIIEKIGTEMSLTRFQKEIQNAADTYGVIVNFGYNEAYDSRKIVGDNYADVNEKYYGNNDTKGPDATHGTHVAGLIAADRKNDIGIKGVADNVRIMSVRAVPNGDERDKDVANAIRYAVDNGAKIINMSFGKGFSPEKATVDRAVKYAEDKGVLLVHAAGNDSDDNDNEPNFPSRAYANGKQAKNWIEVGASASGANENLMAEFSNYGKKSVDLFAPGVDLYSTIIDNQYATESGTSMASPVTAGVAAILMSYFPELTSKEVKDILMKSTRRFGNLQVELKRTKKKIEFSELSVSGGIVNAYDAVKMAIDLKKQKAVK